MSEGGTVGDGSGPVVWTIPIYKSMIPTPSATGDSPGIPDGQSGPANAPALSFSLVCVGFAFCNCFKSSKILGSEDSDIFVLAPVCIKSSSKW